MVFVLLATANGGGYRYGVSDQAFYVPVVVRALDPSLFPRDAPLIDAEGRLMIVDEILAGTAAATGLSLQTIFLVAYLMSVAILWAGLVLVGTRVYKNSWAVAALAAAFTMRHRIPRTSANSFEPYFHPRMLAFGLGVVAIGALLRRRDGWAVGLIGLAAFIHVTTALWFTVMIGIALAVVDVRWRRLVVPGGIAAAVIAVLAVTIGPLRDAVTIMDDVWLQAVSSKDSLFATGWPAWAWMANFGFLALLWWAYRERVRRGDARPEDRALVWGATALVALFVLTLPFVVARLALVVQFQISRVFWLVDFVALIYVIAALAESRHPLTRRAPAVALLLVAAAVSRGAYVVFIEHPERALFEVGIADSPWEQAMTWLAGRPGDAHVLADPGHAWKYGSSVRVSAKRDVLLEEVKDSAIAIYSRQVAGRFVDRTAALGDFSALTRERATDLARRYELNYLVTEADLALPLAYSNAQFRVYALGAHDTGQKEPGLQDR